MLTPKSILEENMLQWREIVNVEQVVHRLLQVAGQAGAPNKAQNPLRQSPHIRTL